MAALAIGHTAWLATLLVAAGACTGMLAGLFGVGGGTVVVPVLYEVFGLYGVPDEIPMPLCIGTSLAVIVPTSISSFAGHYKKGGVDLAVLRTWVFPIIVGVIAGTVVASFAKPLLFKVVFVVVSLFLAARLLAGKDGWRLYYFVRSNRDAFQGSSMDGYNAAVWSSRRWACSDAPLSRYSV